MSFYRFVMFSFLFSSLFSSHPRLFLILSCISHASTVFLFHDAFSFPSSSSLCFPPLEYLSTVVSGLNTQVFKRSGLKKHKEDKCFSIIMRDRTLDFEALTVSECNEWAMALSKLIVLSAYKSPEEHRRHIN